VNPMQTPYALFPHLKVRPGQEDMLKEVEAALNKHKHLVIHAPTGLGKTAAALSVALSHAIKHDYTVFYLTSRHTQHVIVLETLARINKQYEQDIVCADLIGKKWMCLQAGATTLMSGDFSVFCKGLVSDNKCEYYANTKQKNKVTPRAQVLVDTLKSSKSLSSSEVFKQAQKAKLCPYELTMILAEHAKLIIGDYYYLFSPFIQDNLFARTKKQLEKSIIIIDEGHNLPARIRSLMTTEVSSLTLNRAFKEAAAHGREDLADFIKELIKLFKSMEEELEDEEQLLDKEYLIDKVKAIDDYDFVTKELIKEGQNIREEHKTSSLGKVGEFLSAWIGADEGFVRIIARKKLSSGRFFLNISYRCLDPALYTKDIIDSSVSTFIMSGTLHPPEMYRDLLGFPKDTGTLSFDSPFPHENQLNLIVPKTTTKYSQRNSDQYQAIAKILNEATATVPGNTAVFFPSYKLLRDIGIYLKAMTRRTVFEEQSGLTKVDKEGMLEKFKSYAKTGAILLGVTSASFAEGIDLPGDVLKGVFIVGIPLQRPDLETNALINYYDKKFGRGREYGFFWPEFNVA